jgi:hypothetical protein
MFKDFYFKYLDLGALTSTPEHDMPGEPAYKPFHNHIVLSNIHYWYNQAVSLIVAISIIGTFKQ